MNKKHLFLLNRKIFELGEIYPKVFKNMEKIAMPVKSIYYIQRNLNAIIEAAKSLDEARMIVVKKYGVKNKEDGSYVVPKNLISAANEELQELLSQEQEIELYPIPLSWFEGVSLTATQVDSLLIMIEEDKEKEDKDNEEE